MATAKKTKVIAVSGKGGVGKTSIAALIVKLLVDKKPNSRILAIDADPAVGLATALGIDVVRTVDEIRKSFITAVEDGQTRQAIDMLNESRYEIMDTLIEADGFSFLAIGRPEGAGCYCKVNNYLKDIISVLVDEFDYVIIDGEAGIEQVNRRVLEKVTHLLLVSDMSKKGTTVIQSIEKVARDMDMFGWVGAVINLVRDESLKKFVDTGNIPITAFINEDKQLASIDIQGKSVLDIPGDSPSVLGVLDALKKIEVFS